MTREIGSSSPQSKAAERHGVSPPESLAALLDEFRGCFSVWTFPVFCALACGLISQSARRTVCGMYWHLTQTINGRTINRRLTPEQAGLYSEWIRNDRRAKEILTRMREVAAKAAELLLNQALVQQDRTGPKATGGAQRRRSDRSRAQ